MRYLLVVAILQISHQLWSVVTVLVLCFIENDLDCCVMHPSVIVSHHLELGCAVVNKYGETKRQKLSNSAIVFTPSGILTAHREGKVFDAQF